MRMILFILLNILQRMSLIIFTQLVNVLTHVKVTEHFINICLKMRIGAKFEKEGTFSNIQKALIGLLVTLLSVFILNGCCIVFK